MIKLRGHHLLCLHGFRGFGYSPEFVSNMTSIRDKLLNSPELEVEVNTSPDDICSVCPHLAEDRCARKNGSEDRTSGKDAVILERLSLSAGDRLPSGKLFTLAAERFGQGIDDLCSNCSWFSHGWCAEGIREKAMVR